MYMPEIIETTGRSTKAYSLPTKLLQDRIIFIGSEINADGANSVIMQLKWLAADNPDEPIQMYINTPGGSIYDGLAIIDIIDTLPCKVNTVGVGLCASMGAVLLCSSTGTRRATQNCRIMLHSASSGMNRSSVHDLKIDLAETEYLQDKMMQLIADSSKNKLTKEQVQDMTVRDNYLTPEDCVSCGLLDGVILK